MDAAVTTLKFESKAVIPTDPRTKLSAARADL